MKDFILRLSRKRKEIQSEFFYRSAKVIYSLRPMDCLQDCSEIVTNLQSNGVFMTSLNSFDHMDSLLKASDLAMRGLPKTCYVPYSGKHSSSSHTCEVGFLEIVERYPEIYLWGLQPRLRQLASSYLKLPPRYLGVRVRRDIPNKLVVGTRFWHLDSDDYHLFKIFVYLNDVCEGSSPFEYITRTLSQTARHRFKKLKCDVEDEHMAQIVPREKWMTCYGRRGTVVIADTATVFHHGKLPTHESRDVLIYAYSSHLPRKASACDAFFPKHFSSQLIDELSKEQHSFVF